MEEKKYKNPLVPTILDGKSCSADFIEEIADQGKVIWNRKDENEYSGLFFYKNRYVICKYNVTGNSLVFKFERWAEQRNDFEKEVLENIFTDETEFYATFLNLGPEAENNVILFIYYKPEE